MIINEIHFVCRYCFLGFGFNEKVTPNRESCRTLLVRLKIDGWALGKTKVFLKYYHIERLSKLYDEMVIELIRSNLTSFYFSPVYARFPSKFTKQHRLAPRLKIRFYL